MFMLSVKAAVILHYCYKIGFSGKALVFVYFNGNFDRPLECMRVSNLTGIPPGNVFSYLQVGHLLLYRHQRTLFLCKMSIF